MNLGGEGAAWNDSVKRKGSGFMFSEQEGFCREMRDDSSSTVLSNFCVNAIDESVQF